MIANLDMDFDKIGKLIRKVRKERDMTLDDLADDFVPRSTLSSIERGLSRNLTQIRYILRKLDIDISEISTREQEEAEDRSLDLMLIENKINRDERRALSELLELPAEYNSPLLDYLKGRCYYKMNQYERAVEYFNRALRHLEKSIDTERTNLKACCLNHLSVIEFKVNGDKEKALRYVEEGLKSFDHGGKRRYYYLTLSVNKAIYLGALGRAEDALKTLEGIEADSFDINISNIIALYDFRAKLKQQIKMYDEAAHYARQGLELARINYHYERELELYITLGDIYRESGKLDRAEKCLKAAIDLKDEISRREWLILEAYLKLGIVYFEKKDFSLSRKILEKSKKIAKKRNDMLKYTQALLYIAKTCLANSNLEEARSAYMEAYELNPDNLEALNGLSKVSLRLGDDANYVKYSKLFFEAEGLD